MTGPGANGSRPLTARSVIASTLLGVDPPELPTLALVRSGELFGLSEGATRTALSRMAAAGEVVATDGAYALAGPLLDRHARQQEARSPVVSDAWDGTWELALVTAARRTAEQRAALRRAATRCRLAEVREGCWARPANLPADRRPAERRVVATQCTLVSAARPDDVAPFLAAFAPGAWAAHAEALVTAMRAAQPDLDARREECLGATFVLDAAVVRHLVADPLLPAELAPRGWPAAELRAAFAAFDAGFKATWRDWFRRFRDSA